jgi:exfoliative toxin A/B
MIAKLKFMPVASTGLALSLITIFNTLYSFFNNSFLLIIAIILGLFFIGKIILKNIFHFQIFLSELKHPIIGSFIPTLSMAIMALSGSISIFNLLIAQIFWIIGLIIHIALLISFIYFRFKFKDFNKILPSWFIPTIGTTVAIISGSLIGFIVVSKILFIFTILFVFILVPIVLYRIMFLGILKKSIYPVIGIIGAPFNLTLGAFVLLFPIANQLNILILNFLTITAFLSTLIIYLSFLHLKYITFSPLYVSYTFPLAIGAFSTLKYSQYLTNNSLPFANAWYYISCIETAVAIIMISYVAYKILLHIYKIYKV